MPRGARHDDNAHVGVLGCRATRIRIRHVPGTVTAGHPVPKSTLHTGVEIKDSHGLKCACARPWRRGTSRVDAVAPRPSCSFADMTSVVEMKTWLYSKLGQPRHMASMTNALGECATAGGCGRARQRPRRASPNHRHRFTPPCTCWYNRGTPDHKSIAPPTGRKGILLFEGGKLPDATGP